MRAVGVTGMRQCLTSRHRDEALPLLTGFADVPMFVTGACTGFDAYAGLTFVRLYPDAMHRVVLPGDRSRVDPWWLAYLSTVNLDVIIMGLDTTYRDRNATLVSMSTELVGYPAYPEHDRRSARSGTWQTIRMARRAGLTVTLPDRGDEWFR